MLRSMRKLAVPLVALLLACTEPPATGRLAIRVLDGEGGPPVPARLELLDARGTAWVSPDALPLTFECFMAPPAAWAESMIRSDRIPNGPTGTDQFYLTGEGALDLPPGRYRLRVFRGPEVRVAEHEALVTAGVETRLEVPLERWADLASEGWYSVDDHVHITRRSEADSERIATWMAAEDLRVANLLQMGTVDQISVTPQLAFGDAGEYRRGDTTLFAGQEHPRTHFLGHTITLGADALVDRRDTYIVYETTFREGLRQNGLPGYAHWGLGAARTGLTLDAPRELAFFLEVLQFDFPWYRDWYDLLDLGLRIAPTAGTDFPCGPFAGIPGRERFYLRADGPPDRAAMVAAVRAGRTFVTNGPVLELEVEDAGIGDELPLPGVLQATVRARVRFDPTRDDVQHVELVVNGEARPLPTREAAPGDLRVETRTLLDEAGWLALRVRGDKLGETPVVFEAPGGFGGWIAEQIGRRAFDFAELVETSEAYYRERGGVRPSAAHTGAIYLTLPGHERGPHTHRRAREALARIADLEARLGDDRIEDQTLWDWIPYSDAIPLEHLRRNRPALLRAAAEARTHYEALLEEK